MSEVTQATAEATSTAATPTLDNEELSMATDSGTGVNGSGEEMLIADSDDQDKLATFKGTDFEDLDEAAIIAAMATGDEIRSSTTVPAGDYIISIKEVRWGQDVVMLGKHDANGELIPGPVKSVGFRVGIHMELKTNTVMADNMYQTFYLSRKDGSPFANGATDYKRFCASAVSAVMLPNNEKATMKNIMTKMDQEKINPAQLFNQVAASTEDNIIYLRARLTESPETDRGPAQNSIVTTTIKDDKGYYQQLVNS